MKDKTFKDLNNENTNANNTAPITFIKSDDVFKELSNQPFNHNNRCCIPGPMGPKGDTGEKGDVGPHGVTFP